MNRQAELVAINKVLAAAVVILAFSTGLLLAERQTWLGASQTETPPEVIENYPLPNFNGIIVSAPKNSLLTGLLKQARFSWQVEAGTMTKETFLALVWATQGQITEWGERTVPSYKSTFPLQLGVWVQNVTGVNPGYYRFDADNQELVPESTAMAMDQANAAAVFVLYRRPNNSADQQMVWHEAGAAAQNLLLMAHEQSYTAVFVPTAGSTDGSLWKISIGKGNI